MPAPAGSGRDPRLYPVSDFALTAAGDPFRIVGGDAGC